MDPNQSETSAQHEHASWNPAFRPDSTATIPDHSLQKVEQIDRLPEIASIIPTSTVPYIEDHASQRMAKEAGAKPESAAHTTVPEAHTDSSTEANEFAKGAPSPSINSSLPTDEQHGWGNEDLVDPAWGLPSGSHTNSFPEVPPLPKSSLTPIHSLAHSQAESIMEEVEHEYTDPGTTQGEEQDVAGEDDDFFTKTNEVEPAEPVEPSDNEARYEEGLPLVPHEPLPSSQAPPAVSDPTDTTKSFAPSFDEYEAGGDFFSNIGASQENVPEPPTLDRKSTHQVMSSMEFASHSTNNDTVIPPKPFFKDEYSAGATGDGAGISLESGDDVEKAPKEEDLAALWEATLGEDELLDDELLEDDAGIDPSSFFDDDGEGFLEDIGEDAVSPAPATSPSQPQQPQQPQTSKYRPASSYTPAANHQPAAHQSPYAPNGVSNVSMGANSNYGQHQASPQRPDQGERTQSFVDKSKSGYSSPYDAPMDLSRPKRRPAQFQIRPISGSANTAPPPRSSSMNSEYSPSLPSLYSAVPTNKQTAPIAGQALAELPSGPRPQLKPSASTFFEELPMAPKLRAPAAPRAAAQPAMPTPPPSRGFQPGPPPPAGNFPNQYGLVAPARAVPFADSLSQAYPPQVASQPGMAPQPPRTAPPNSRYSPAPAAQIQNIPNRYAVPGVGAPPRPPSATLAHVPRTSSPLTRSMSASQPSQQYRPAAQVASTSISFPASSAYAPMPSHGMAPPPTPAGPLSSQAMQQPSERIQSYAPPSQTRPENLPSATQSRSNYAPVREAAFIERPQVNQRSFVQEATSSQPYSFPAKSQSPDHQRRARPGEPSITPNFVIPTDGREDDPLKRWQGAPMFSFGFGGNIVVSFPQRTPRYVAGQAFPMIKCNPGAVKVQTAELVPLDEHLGKFPGPLKSKGKKKDVLDWLQKEIERLDRLEMQNSPKDTWKRHEEKALLWKIIHIMVENDGILEGNPAVEKAVRDVLTPEPNPGGVTQSPFGSSTFPTGITSNGAQISREPAGVEQVEALRKLLLAGEREKAVWHAVDHRLWGHAMLIASTLPKETWKQVAQEFVKLDVKPVGENTESLAALYDIFAGNWEESVDRLVPPSARAGHQMISKGTTNAPVKNALDGLDHWRETLNLILSNRSSNDPRSMVALGQMLSTYGRIEAAQICFLFSRTPGLFNGADDPQALIALLGADHRQQPVDYAKDLNCVLLTETYEFASSILSSSSTALPHLQPFKLYHAMVLADHGSREKAQQYCDVIASSLKSTTKMSPYYHNRLFASLDDLSSRLKQAPKDGSGSWISKPSMDKVSSSFFNKFTSFVAGDDSGGASASGASAMADVDGPFARISGDTPPSISRAGSPSEGYGFQTSSMYTPLAAPGAPPANLRYAPGGYAVRSMPEQPSLNRRPSQLSMQSSSPDLPRHSFTSAYQPGPRHIASPLNPESQPHHGTPPARTSYSPEVPFHARFETSQASPDLQQPPSGVGTPETSSASPYEPKRNTYQPSSSSSYDSRPAGSNSRSASYGPRSYQPSPVGEEGISSAQVQESSSYEPQFTSQDDLAANTPPQLHTPAISRDPPTPRAQSHSVPSFSYEPSAASYDLSLPTDDKARTVSETVPPEYSPPRYGNEPRPALSDGVSASSIYEPPSSNFGPPLSGYEPPSSSYEPPSSSGYEPPSSGYEPPRNSYEPPSYQPYEPEDTDELHSPKSPKKKKSFLELDDEEDELIARAAALKGQTGPRPSAAQLKAETDRAADEAFRKAAEADAARDKRPSLNAKPSGWLGGWFGGKANDGDMGNAGGANKPIKAKLGEESSFVFDPVLKKWVNKNATGEAATPSAPTPPPPRGPPSRQPSTSNLGPGGPPGGARPPNSNPTPPIGGPPSRPMSRNVSPSLGGTPPMAIPSAGGSALPSGLAPPSRPGTGMSGMSNTSSIDDLIGVPQARKGGTIKKAKKRNAYVDVMAK